MCVHANAIMSLHAGPGGRAIAATCHTDRSKKTLDTHMSVGVPVIFSGRHPASAIITFCARQIAV